MVLRGFLLVVVSVLFFVGLLVGGALLTVSYSLSYSNIEKELVPVITEFIGQEIDLDGFANGDYLDLQKDCAKGVEAFLETDSPTNIPCDVVEQGSDAVVNYAFTNFIHDVYYKEYNCEFWDCMGQDDLPFFLVSQHAQNYWKSKFYLVLLTSLVMFILIFLLVEKKSNSLVLAGILLIASSLPLLGINYILSLFESSPLTFLTTFFTSAYSVFWIFFIMGFLVLAVGITSKLTHVGEKLYDLFSRDKKDLKVKAKVEKGKK